ncbi:hypothetical protein BCV69DRAFT_281592 [Microstroma glucosiphilum]|uniref:Hamartin-domain-containing protein n=1 Tax=Pseudomicrostroma glucosiphilum TaxID=1684307 RepID=A0A316UBU5_9BASI|nr:hypothetical protein BCV69DRAFT_281592 [Pseudomicrostroma glucosiphilum]PWN22602.1 hypothetical protein BCV69DRAFT_281592 [Pseudomicrostroma glucosiphilum]
MPPPNFTVGSQPVQPVHVPKATQARLKDALARIRSVLLAQGPTKAQASADKAIEALINDPNVTPAEFAGMEAQQLKSQVSQKFNSDLLSLWDEMDQEDSAKQATLVGYISELAPLIGSVPIVTEWFDILLRPILKDPRVSDHLADQARGLVIMAALATPSSAYKDEPPPTPLWPNTSDNALSRVIGGAPYPRATTESLPSDSAQRGRSGPPGEKPRSGAAGGPGSRKAGGQAVDMHRRFTQRLFDLYTQEASAPLRQEDDEGDRLDVLDQLQASTASLTPADGPSPSTKVQVTKQAQPYLLQAVASDDAKPVDIAGTTWKGNLEAIIITFGQDRPTEFFHHLSASFEEPLHRIPILLLLTIFVRLNSIHAYHITKTSLLSNIALSLQLDTSTMLVSLCITSLIMLIPHMPDWIASGGAGGVPALLAIFARIVDWRKLGPGWEHRVGSGEEMESLRMQFDEEHEEVGRLSKRLQPRADVDWKRLESSVDSETATAPDAVRFFTIIYGIFPCNTLRFLRGPIDYLRKSQYQSPLDAVWEDLIHEPELQKRSEVALRRHALHPSLVSSNAELELTKKERWEQHDAADITAECIGLSVESWQTVSWDRQQTESLARPTTTDQAYAALSRRSSNAASLPRYSKMLEPSLDAKDHMNLTEGTAAPMEDVLNGYTDLRWGQTFRRLSLASAASVSPGPTPTSRMPRSATLQALTSNIAAEHGSGALSAGPSSPVLGRTGPSPLSRPVSPTAGELMTPAATPNQSTSSSQSGRGRAPNMATTTSPPSTATAASIPIHAAFSSDFRPQVRSVSGRPATSLTGNASFALDQSPSSMSSPTFSSRPHAGAGTSAALSSITVSPSRPVRGRAHLGRSDRATMKEVSTHSGAYTVVKYLQRENLLLRGELNFELYLKDQHLRHIGRLLSNRIKASSSEAQRQNLIRMVKSLRTQLSALDVQMTRQKNEAHMTKSRHAQWESELQSKLKAFRDERRNWTSESRELKAELEALKANHEAQTRQLNEASAELFELKTQMDSIAPKVIKVKEYEEKNAHLTHCLTLWDQDVKRFEEQHREMEVFLGQWREMEMLLDASDEERRHLETALEKSRLSLEKAEREKKQMAKQALSGGGDNKSIGALPPGQTGEPSAGSSQDESSVSTAAPDGDGENTREVQNRLEQLEAEVLALRARAEEAEAELGRTRIAALAERRSPHLDTISTKDASLKSLRELQELLFSPEPSSAGAASSLPNSVGTEGSGIDDSPQPFSLGSPHLAVAEAGAASASLGQVIQEAEALEAEREARRAEGKQEHEERVEDAREAVPESPLERNSTD